MSREIDLTKPLTEDERQYLIDRDKWVMLARADGHDDVERAKREAVERNDITQGRRPPTLVGEQAVVQQINAQMAVEQENPDPLADKPYDEWPYKALQEELKVRKQEALDAGMDQAQADELYKAGGAQADLVKRLEADDERVAALESQ